MKKKNENINCGPGRSNEKIHLKLLISKKSKAPPEKKENTNFFENHIEMEEIRHCSLYISDLFLPPS